MSKSDTGNSRIVIFNDAGKVLILRRGPQDDKRGLWDFPGGKRDPCDLLQKKPNLACALRELKEETGIVSEFIKKIEKLNRRVRPRDGKIFTVFTAKAKKGLEVNLPAEEDHDKYKWVKPSKLPVKFNPATLRTITYKGSPFKLSR